MARIERQPVEEIAEITQEMIDLIKDEIRKFKSYDDFLYSVKSMDNKNILTVLKYQNEDFDWYENTYVRKYFGQSLNNMFIFKKYANIKKNIAVEGKPNYVDSGYFIPRVFWDFVNKQKSSKYKHQEFVLTKELKEQLSKIWKSKTSVYNS